MNAHLGLYFPSFHFPDDEWVKLSALYWDKIYRIVPDRYETPRDTKTVIELAKKENRFIENLHPENFIDEMQETTKAFQRLLREHHRDLVKRYGGAERSGWLSIFKRSNTTSKLASINNLKIDHSLRKDLLESGLGVKSDESDYIKMHPKLVNVYMAALAKAMAGSSPFNASPITNDPINYFAVGGFSFERLTQILLEDAEEFAPKSISPDEIESRIAFLVIKCVQPENIKDVPIDKIIAVRKKYNNEMGRFQDFIQDMVNELPNVKEAQSTPFVNDFLEKQYGTKVKPKLDDLEETLKSLGIKTIESFLNIEVKVPSLLTSAGLAVINPVLGITTGLGFGLFKTYSEIKDRRKSVEKEIRNSDVAYLLRVKEDLAPINSLTWLESRARHLTFGV